MSIQHSALIAILAACGGAPHSLAPTSVRVIESQQRSPDLMRQAGNGTLVSRTLLSEPDFASAGISRDGKFYSLLEPSIGGAVLHVAQMGAASHPLVGLNDMAWVGEHTLLYRQYNTWYRADADDDSFTKFTSSKIVEVGEDRSDVDASASVSSDGNRVIFSVPTEKDSKKRSPWVYDVRTREKKELLHNTRYDRIIVDENERPVFAVDRDAKDGLQVFERTDRGWLERTVDLPPHTFQVLELEHGKLELMLGSESKPRIVSWDPATSKIEDVVAPGVTRIVRAGGRRTVLTLSGRTWNATDPSHQAIAAELTLLGVDYVHAVNERFWTASATVGDDDALYAIDVQARTIRELGPHRDRKTAATFDGQNDHMGPDDESPVKVYAAVAPIHGVVFYGGSLDWLYRDKLFRLFTSRGYHVVAGFVENAALTFVRESHVAWARSKFGSLPIACVDVLVCEKSPGLVAVIYDERTPWTPPWDGAQSTMNELSFGAGFPRARRLDEYDEEQEYLRTEIAPERDRAPVVGIALRGDEKILVSRFALIEGFLAQHLGGRMEPMAWDELHAAGVKVAYGMSKVPFLEGRKDLVLTALTKAERDELVAGFAALADAYRDAFAQGCTGVAQRVSTLKRPASLDKYRESNEYIVLSYQFQSERRDHSRRACDEENAADNAISAVVDNP